MNQDRVFPAIIVMSGCDLRPEVRQQLREVFGDNVGLSLRDWFAGQALAMLADPATGEQMVSDTAQAMYRIADAMLKAREKATTEEKV